MIICTETEFTTPDDSHVLLGMTTCNEQNGKNDYLKTECKFKKY